MSDIMLSINTNQSGEINKLMIPLASVGILLLIALGFGVWAYGGKQDYKNNTNQKIAQAVAAAQKQQKATDAASSAAAEQEPLLTYKGPSEYGSLTVEYPKNWSAYVAAASPGDSSANPIDGYFQPGFVPDIQDPTNVFALRIEIIQQSYDEVLQQLDSQAQGNQITVTPYALPKVPSAIGVMVNGAIEQNVEGIMVVLPLRDTTLEIWTEASSYESDFNSTILPNLSFSP